MPFKVKDFIGDCFNWLILDSDNKDFKLNIEVNHATLAGHTFQHDLQVAADAGLLGSIDANRGDYQNGWDTDQFPINLYELIEAMLVIVRGGGFTSGGINFDAKTRRNSTDLEDIFFAHIGGADTFARALLIADKIITSSPYEKLRTELYDSKLTAVMDRFEFEKNEEIEQNKKIWRTPHGSLLLCMYFTHCSGYSSRLLLLSLYEIHYFIASSTPASQRMYDAPELRT